jgi:uncharacterized repeat protein (TIGR01451 family)
MPLSSVDRHATTPPLRRRRIASRIGATAAAAGTFLAFGALGGPVLIAEAVPTGPMECGDTDCVTEAFREGYSFALTSHVIVGRSLELAENAAMTVDLGVHTLTVTAPNGLPGDSSVSDGVVGESGEDGESGLAVGAGAVLTVMGSGTLAVTGGDGGNGGNGSQGFWLEPGGAQPGTSGGRGGDGGSGILNLGTLVIGCDPTVASIGGNGGNGGDGGGPLPAGFRNSVQGRAFLMTATVSDGNAGEEGEDKSTGEDSGRPGGAGGGAGDAGTGIANGGALVSCGSAVTGVSGNSGAVTFDSNGADPAQVVVYAADAADAVGALSETEWSTPVLASATFQGWYLGVDAKSEGADFKGLALDTTVYAHWTSSSSSSSSSPPPSSSPVVASSSSASSTIPVTTSSPGPAPTTAPTSATTISSSSTPSGGAANLAIGVASSTPTASGGDTVTLTLSVTNPSGQDADDVQATLQLQPTMHFDGASTGDSGQGFRRAAYALRDAPAAPLRWVNCAVAGADAAGYGGLLTCDLSDVLKAGAAAPALLVKTTIRPGTPPTRIDAKAASHWTSNGAQGRVEAAVNLTVPDAPPALANTGIQTAWRLSAAAVLLAAGVGLMLVSRRRAGARSAQ